MTDCESAQLTEGEPRDRGVTFVEIVVSIVLIGMIVTVLTTGLFHAIRFSTFSKDQAKTEAVLGNAADRLAFYPWSPCPLDGEGSYLDVVQAAASTVDWPPSTVQILSIRYWNPSAGDIAIGSYQPVSALAGCPESRSITAATTLQLVTIKVTSPNGGYNRTMEVVKDIVRPIDDPTTP